MISCWEPTVTLTPFYIDGCFGFKITSAFHLAFSFSNLISNLLELASPYLSRARPVALPLPPSRLRGRTQYPPQLGGHLQVLMVSPFAGHGTVKPLRVVPMEPAAYPNDS